MLGSRKVIAWFRLILVAWVLWGLWALDILSPDLLAGLSLVRG